MKVNFDEVVGGDVVKIGSSDLVDVGFSRGTGVVEVTVLDFQDDVLGFRTWFVPLCTCFGGQSKELILGETRSLVVRGVVDFEFGHAYLNLMKVTVSDISIDVMAGSILGARLGSECRVGKPDVANGICQVSRRREMSHESLRWKVGGSHIDRK
jgi:hypothetical protein